MPAFLQDSGQLFEVFMPDDAEAAGLTLAEMSEEQLTSYRQRRHSAFQVSELTVLLSEGCKLN